MNQKNTILVAEDLNTEGEARIKRGLLVGSLASKLAQKLNCKLELFHAIEALTLAGKMTKEEQDSHALISSAKTALTETAKKLEIEAEIQVYPGRAITGILQELRNKPFEMVVQGSQAKRGFQRLIVGSVAEEVIRHAKIPVVTVGPEVEAIELSESPKILVATDLGETTERALTWAIQTAKLMNAEVILSHCPFRGYDAGIHSALGVPYIPIYSDSLYKQIVEDAREALNKQAKMVQEKGVRCRLSFREDQLFPEDALLMDVQKEKPFLLVMGTHSKNLFSSFYFGSTTRKMILSAPVPVVTVKSIN
jgi:nucleotide-binding universal stress UspA family protein